MDMLTSLFITTTLQLGLPPNLLSSICYIETRHDITAIHYNDGGEDSIGICQLHLSTAQGLGFKGTEEELMEPQTNIYYAGLYLKHQIIRYKNLYNKAVIAYNMGHAGDLTTTKYQVAVYKQWRND